MTDEKKKIKGEVPSEKERDRLKIDLGEPQYGDIIARINSGAGNKAKRRVNTHGRMKRSQNEVGEILQEAFGETFHQTPGSGSYSTFNVGKVSKNEAKAFAGDVRVRGMKFIIEVKSGYEDVSLDDLFIPDDKKGGKSSKDEIRDWIKEVERYEAATGMHGLVFWKKPRRRIVVIAREDDFKMFREHMVSSERNFSFLRFDRWCIFDIQHLVKLPKEVLFEAEQ